MKQSNEAIIAHCYIQHLKRGNVHIKTVRLAQGALIILYDVTFNQLEQTFVVLRTHDLLVSMLYSNEICFRMDFKKAFSVTQNKSPLF